jgi:hypothetical protein
LQTIKSEVLKRVRCFNVVELVDEFAANYDLIYEGRMLRFAYGKDVKRINAIKATWKKGSAMQSAGKVTGALPKPTVDSESKNGVTYVVDTGLGVCECPVGYRGRYCKHMAAVSKQYNMVFPGVLTLEQNSRYNLARLASGPKAGHSLADFSTLHSTAALPQAAAAAASAPDDPPSIGDLDLHPSDLDVVFTGLNLTDGGAAGPLRLALTQDEEQLLFQKAQTLSRLHKRAAKLGSSTHGFPAVAAAMDSQIALLSKLTTGGQYMNYMQMQSGAMKANRKKNINVNNAAIIRRKTKSGSRKALRPGPGRKKQNFHQAIGPAAPPLAKPLPPQLKGKHNLQISPAKASARQPSGKRSRSRGRSSSGKPNG